MTTLIYNNEECSVGPNEDCFVGQNEDYIVGPSYVPTDDENKQFCYALCEYNIICPCYDCRQSSINGYCLPNCDCAICFHYRNCYDMATCNCRENGNAMYIAAFCKDWTLEEVAEHHSDSKDANDNSYDSDCDAYDRVYPTIAAPTRVVFDCGNCGICLYCTSTFPCGCMDVCLCDGYNEDTNYDSD